MTTATPTDDESEAIIAAGLSAAERIREQIKAMERAKAGQPERLAKARSDAEEARGWALLEEPFDDQVSTVKSVDGTAHLHLPTITAKELWATRLVFDILDCGDDHDLIDAVLSRLFTTVKGNTGIAFLITSSALSTIASLIVPELLAEIEQSASNYDVRVKLAEARAKSWNDRVAQLLDAQDNAAECGVKLVDGFDIGATALDPEADPDGGDQ